MAGAKDTNAGVTRWFLALQYFRFTVDHRPGREHANADALSRRDACLGGFLGYPRPEQAVEGLTETLKDFSDCVPWEPCLSVVTNAANGFKP